MRSSSSSINQDLFRAYDIRGIVPEELSPDLVHDLGLAIGTFVQNKNKNQNNTQKKTVIVARDGRLSGPELIQALKDGLKKSGVNIIDIGMVPTPVLYFAVKKISEKLNQTINSGVMLTGSHNPKNYNGLKMVLNGETIAGDDIQALYQILKQEIYIEHSDVNKIGTEQDLNILKDYETRVLSEIKLARQLKVVIDCGSGVTGVLAPELIKKLGCEVIGLFTQVDGCFPHHHPDPSKPKNLQDLQEAVLKNQADIGLAFDGDGDRLGVITSSGKIIWPDRQVMLYAQDVLKRFKNNLNNNLTKQDPIILYDVKCTKDLAEIIIKAGGIPRMCPTGHSLVKKEIARTNALLAGEMSGHIFFNDTWYGFDDAIYTAARLLRILSEQDLTSDELFKQLPESVTTPEINISVPDAEKFNLIKKIIEAANLNQNRFFPGAEIITIDGLRVEFKTGFALIRVSNTTPCFVLRFEAESEKELSRIQDNFKKFLLECVPDLTWKWEI